MSAPPSPETVPDGGTELPASVLSLALGGVAALFALMGQFGPTRGVVSWIDLPATLTLFIADAAWMLRATQRGPGGTAGLLLAAVAVLVAALGLILRRDHPWLG